jgi:transposase InsO family protein
MVTAPARRELVRWMRTKGVTERRGLAVVGMSASSLRYEPRPDRNVELRGKIVALAQRHRRYGVGMIYLKLRQAGDLINYKRVERLYRLEKLQIRRRRRKKIPMSERQPLIRPGAANEVWSIDFVFDRGRHRANAQVPGDCRRRDPRGRGHHSRTYDRWRPSDAHPGRDLCAARQAGDDPYR